MPEFASTPRNATEPSCFDLIQGAVETDLVNGLDSEVLSKRNWGAVNQHCAFVRIRSECRSAEIVKFDLIERLRHV